MQSSIKMATLVEKTLEACNLLNLREIPKQWSDQAWENDFCVFEGLPDVLEENVEANQYYKRGLGQLLACCRTWSTTTQDSTVEGTVWIWESKHSIFNIH